MGLPRKNTVAIYAPTFAQATDRNLIHAAVRMVKAGVPCNLYQGTSDSRDKLTLLGIVSTQSGEAFFDAQYGPFLTDSSLLKDENGDVWVIVGTPNRMTHFRRIACYQCLLSQVQTGQIPSGID